MGVVESKSISKASDKTFLSQPAITQAIAKLENNLQTTLFERRSNGMYATESGNAFAYRVGRALENLLYGVRGAVRIGAGKGQIRPSRLLQSMTTTQLRALIAVTEAHNFSIASRNLGVSQSSLHRAARELESLLEIVLFEKTSIGISASKAAHFLAREARLAFAEIAQGRDEINSLHNREIGRIVVGSMPLARTSLLPMAVIEFSSNYPDFNFSIVDGPYDDLLYHLRHGEIDLLIGALRFPMPSDDVVQEELFSSAIAIVARHDHPFCRSEHISLEMLADSTWVVPRSGAPTRAIFESIFVSAGMAVPERLIEASSLILIRSLLQGSDRLALISEHQVQHELDTGTLTTVAYDLSHSFRPIGITMRKSWEPTTKQLSFINILRKNAPASRVT
jgi:DNA-binding transcriptional LysR family regulator